MGIVIMQCFIYAKRKEKNVHVPKMQHNTSKTFLKNIWSFCTIVLLSFCPFVLLSFCPFVLLSLCPFVLLYTIFHTLDNSHYTLHYIHDTLHIVHFTLYITHFSIYIIHYTLCTLHIKLYTLRYMPLHYTLYTDLVITL